MEETSESQPVPHPPECECAYCILHLLPTCTAKEIKIAYHKASLSEHPDKHPNSEDPERQTVKFQRIVEAYEILKDAERRQRYDENGYHDNPLPEETPREDMPFWERELRDMLATESENRQAFMEDLERLKGTPEQRKWVQEELKFQKDWDAEFHAIWNEWAHEYALQQELLLSQEDRWEEWERTKQEWERQAQEEREREEKGAEDANIEAGHSHTAQNQQEWERQAQKEREREEKEPEDANIEAGHSHTAQNRQQWDEKTNSEDEGTDPDPQQTTARQSYLSRRCFFLALLAAAMWFSMEPLPENAVACWCGAVSSIAGRNSLGPMTWAGSLLATLAWRCVLFYMTAFSICVMCLLFYWSFTPM
jgi:curved DNA-binding protein CbpA